LSLIFQMSKRKKSGLLFDMAPNVHIPNDRFSTKALCFNMPGYQLLNSCIASRRILLEGDTVLASSQPGKTTL
jgi:hypothetical protein